MRNYHFRNEKARRSTKKRRSGKVRAGVRSLHHEPLESRLALSASPVLLDINPEGPSNPSNFVQVGDVTYFVANDGTNGRELWVTNGTIPGTRMVADIHAGPGSSNPSNLVNVGGVLFFAADDGDNGRELWRSDGTEAGTVMVRDIFPGTHTGGAYETLPNSSNPDRLTDVDGTLFFTARDGVNGIELWKSDGTADGTVLVRNIYEGTAPGSAAPASSIPHGLINVNGTLFFTADDGENGRELWKSDGTEAGTQLVKNIYTGTGPIDPEDENSEEAPNSSHPGLLTVVNNTLFFVAQDGEHGAELWRTDGTEAGTYLVKDIREGEEGAFTNFSLMVEMNGMLLFSANDGIHGDELWRSDGTEEGTVLVKDIWEGEQGNLSLYGGLTVVNGVLYFAGDDGETGKELWRSDGTEEGTVLVANIRPGTYEDGTPRPSFPFYLTEVNGTLYFSAYSDGTGRELWQSDGTAEGTRLVADLSPGGESTLPSSLAAVGTSLFFSGMESEDSRELWMLDTNASVGLTIYVNGESIELPANIGVYDDGSTAAGYTIADDGRIYLDSSGSVTLAEFFATWQTDAGIAGNNPDAVLTPNQVLTHVADTTFTLQAFVDGMVVTDFVNYELQGSEEIVLVYSKHPVVSLVTNFGAVIIELYDDATPGTVENFLNYVNDGRYINSFFHRSVANFVIQGGGFTTSSPTFTNTSQFTPVPTDPPITNEPGISNLRGTIAMAKQSGNPHSATSQFFINLGDNSSLDLPTNNEFTVFGNVITMSTVDRIASLPIVTGNPSPYGELPMTEDNELVVVTAVEGLGLLTVFAVNDAYEVETGGVLVVDAASGVLANDTHADGEALTAMLETEPSNGTLEFNENGSFTYTPNEGFHGTDTFTYIASDGEEQSKVATVTITVLADPDRPTAADDTFSVSNTGTSHTLDVLANDLPGEGQDEMMIIAVTPGSQGGTVTIHAESVTILYTPASGFTGTETFTYTVENGAGLTDTATVTVTVTGIGNSTISGYVYLDANGNEVHDGGEFGVPGVLITLTGTSTSNQNISRTVLTADDGSYKFDELPAGTYQITQSQPAALVEGTAVTTIPNATVNDNTISDIVLGTASEFTDNNFGQTTLKPGYVSIRWFFGSSQGNNDLLRNMVALAESDAGNDELAEAIRNGETSFVPPEAESQAAIASVLTDNNSAPPQGAEMNLAMDASAASDETASDFVLMETPTFDETSEDSAGTLFFIPENTETGSESSANTFDSISANNSVELAVDSALSAWVDDDEVITLLEVEDDELPVSDSAFELALHDEHDWLKS